MTTKKTARSQEYTKRTYLASEETSDGLSSSTDAEDISEVSSDIASSHLSEGVESVPVMDVEVPLPLSSETAIYSLIDTNELILQSEGIELCRECRSQKRTDLNGELICPNGKKDCPTLKQVTSHKFQVTS